MFLCLHCVTVLPSGVSINDDNGLNSVSAMGSAAPHSGEAHTPQTSYFLIRGMRERLAKL